MRLIGRDILNDFRRRHSDADGPVKAWVAEVEDAQWSKPAEVKERHPRASILAGNRMVFRLKGNDYRLLVRISYKSQIVQVDRIGIHAEYDRWNL